MRGEESFFFLFTAPIHLLTQFRKIFFKNKYFCLDRFLFVVREGEIQCVNHSYIYKYILNKKISLFPLPRTLSSSTFFVIDLPTSIQLLGNMNFLGIALEPHESFKLCS